MVDLSYIYDKKLSDENYVSKKHFVDKKLGFQVIERGMVLPYRKSVKGYPHKPWGYGGIVDENGEYIPSYINNGSGAGYTPPHESIQYSSETVVYLGMIFHSWGHLITDGLRFLWFLKSGTYKKEFKNCPLIYITYENKTFYETNPNFMRLFKVLGIDIDEAQLVTQPTQFDKIILPDESFYFDKDNDIYFTNKYRETIALVKDFALRNQTPTSSKKIYFYHGLRQMGEERVAEYFKSKGYDVISPEKRANSFEETLNLLINAESFASTVGSCSHDSLFLREGTETIIIRRLLRRFNTYQQVINEVNSLKAIYMDTTMSIFPSGLYCYVVGEKLKSFFGDKFEGYTEDDYKIFLAYVKDSLLKGCAVNLDIINNSEIFKNFYAHLMRQTDLIASCDMPPEWETFRPRINYTTYRGGKWSTWINENQISDPLDQKVDIQAIMIIPPRPTPFHKVYCSVYYNDEEGWSEESVAFKTPLMAGVVGKNKAIYGIKIRLDEAGTKEFDILYRVHKFDGEWTDWAKNGEMLYSYGQKLNAIQIKLEPKT